MKLAKLGFLVFLLSMIMVACGDDSTTDPDGDPVTPTTKITITTLIDGSEVDRKVVEGKDGVFLLVAEGESVPGPVLEIGNTNSRYKFPISAKDFMNQWSKQGPAHHCAIGTGHIADKIEKLGYILSIDVIRIV